MARSVARIHIVTACTSMPRKKIVMKLAKLLAVIRKRTFSNFGRPAHFHGSGVIRPGAREPSRKGVLCGLRFAVCVFRAVIV